MNDRIQELADKAFDEYYLTDNAEFGVFAPNEFCEKFAELIVKECASIYEKIDNGNAHKGTEDYLLALKRHFDL